jgi:uncharacterized protein YkwD
LVTLLNERRRALGLPEVRENADNVEAARDCAQQNVDNGTFGHCGHEVLYAGGNNPQAIMDAWFSSPAHKQALTYASSRNAGAAIIDRGDGSVIAALNIDY